MQSKRIIPTFLLKGKRLVKGTNFSNYVDVGDPVSQTKIYDSQGADEIIICDIEATKENRIIDTSIISKITYHSHTPIAVGGGIDNLSKAVAYFEAGADKIIVNTGSLEDPSLIKDLSSNFGAQSIVVSIDVKKDVYGNYIPYSNSGRLEKKIELGNYIKEIIKFGCGEIMLTSIDKDGTLSGFELELYKKYADKISVPLIASGGANCYDDIVDLFRINGIDACGIGKMFFLRNYDIIGIKSYLTGKKINVRDA